MRHPSTNTTRLLALTAGLTTGLSGLALGLGGAASAAPAGTGVERAATTYAAQAACVPGADAGGAARVRKGSKAQEPKLARRPYHNAPAYGQIPDQPTLAAGSVTIDTVFHVVSAAPLTTAERTRREQQISDQIDVLNESYAGETADDAADTPFRFDLTDTTYTVNEQWADVAPGKTERDMKKALHEGGSETLNVYAADIGGGLLGWAYFPKGYNNGRDYIDGVVILDESMPGGTADPYAEGDTLTHEVGHWLMLEHTFAGACSAKGDGVEDTPREAIPQFGCPEGADTCAAPGLDPVHNFMDYSVDSCMDMLTAGQSARMSDAWQAFRAGGNG